MQAGKVTTKLQRRELTMDPDTIERAGWIFWSGVAVIACVAGVVLWRSRGLIMRERQLRSLRRYQREHPRVFGR